MLGTWTVKTHLPGIFSWRAVSSAMATTDGGRPARSSRFSRTSLKSLVSASRLSPNLSESIASSLVQIAEAGFLVGVEQRAAADEIAVGVLEKELLLRGELQLGALVVDGLDRGRRAFRSAGCCRCGRR